MDNATPIVDLEGVHKYYSAGVGEVHALRGIDLRIRAGEYVTMMGQSGSGKTTLLEILGCLSMPTEGSYRFNGEPVCGLNSDALAALRGKQIGFVFQSFNLLDRATLAENVALPLAYRGVGRIRRERAAVDALKRVGLGGRERHLPTEVSGGEKQRAAIARALIGDPSLVLADEPTGNLDVATGKEILKIFDEIHAAGNTLVIVTHDPQLAAASPRQLTIRDGRILEDKLRDRS